MSTKLAPSVILVLLATLLATPLAAQTSRPTTVPTADGARADSAPADGTVASELVARIEAQLAAIRKTHELPAIAACVVRRGKVLANVAIGQRRADDPTAVSTEDLWHLGSCTKAMTATMLARLVERGRLRWDSTIGEITAQAKGFAATHAGWRAVTIAQLLRHRAGMPANPPRTAYEIAARLEPEVRARRHRVIASVLERPPASAPGSREE